MARWRPPTRIGSLSTLVLLALTLALGAAGAHLPGLAWLDERLYDWIAWLRPAPPAAEVALVEVPPPEAGENAAHRLSELGDLLEELAAAQPEAIALLADGSLASALAWSESGARLLRRARGLDVLIGWPDDSAGPVPDDVEAVTLEATRVTALRSYWPRSARLHPLPEVSAAGAHPLDAAGGGHQPLLWRDGERLVPGLVAALAARAGDTGAPVWEEGRALRLGERRVPTSLEGDVYSPVAAASAFRRLDWRQALEGTGVSVVRGELVLVGPADSPAMEAVARGVTGLLGEDTAWTPWWIGLGTLGAPVIVAVCLVLVVSRLGGVSAFLFTLLVGVVILAAQAGLLLARGVWLPAGGSLALLAVGYPLVRAGRRARLAAQRQRREVDRIRRVLAEHQLGAGELKAAFNHLSRCEPVDEVLELMYRVGLAHERRRDYTDAVEVFRVLSSRRSGYRDVASHLQALEAVPGEGGSESLSGARTLVLPTRAVQRPVLGRYEVERELGRGAMGVVYLARDPKIGRQVAIKTLEFARFEADELAVFRERFTREAKAAGRLNHPGIVTIYDVGEEDDLAFIAMDYVPGQTLSAFTDGDHLLPTPVALRLVVEVADALDYAHRQQIVHRDIKPGNLIYNPEEDRVKVTDFGIARMADSSRTRTGGLVGSPSYMAPEQMTGDTVDGRADVFSLGVTLYQMVTGELPFTGDNLAGLAYQITKGRHEDVRTVRPDLPAGLSRIVNRALKKKPGSRYQTAGEMAEALRRITRRLGEGTMGGTLHEGTMQ